MNENELRNALARLGRKIGEGESIVDGVMQRIDQIRAERGQGGLTRRIKMLNAYKKTGIGIAAAAVVVAAIGIGLYLVVGTAEKAYAWEQTLEAWKTVRFIHMVRDDEHIKDDRWIEVSQDGRQQRYRQDSKALQFDFLVVDDRQIVWVYHRGKETVVIWDAKDKQYTWATNVHEALEKISSAQTTAVIEENVDYNGRVAHRLRWLTVDMDIYVDPDSRLPIAMSGWEFSYEEPPEGVFDIPVTPEGVAIVDKRPGAKPSKEPEWMTQLPGGEDVEKQFALGKKAFVEGDYEAAIEHLSGVVQQQKLRNWAHFWLGRAYYETRRYDEAIATYTRVIRMFKLLARRAPGYVCLARGLAYRQKGMEDEARRDFGTALPTMILALRKTEGTRMFDQADTPEYRMGKYKPTEKQSLTMMIERLREVTGEDFGYDPHGTDQQNEQAICAWENWWAEHAGEYGADAE